MVCVCVCVCIVIIVLRLAKMLNLAEKRSIFKHDGLYISMSPEDILPHFFFFLLRYAHDLLRSKIDIALIWNGLLYC